MFLALKVFPELPPVEIEALPNRAEIIDDVRLGHISPNMAERWISNMGWKPLPEFENKASFDPMRAPEWTLPMAAAWFIWRSVDAVRDQWPTYRRAWLANADPDNLWPELEVSLSKLFASADLTRLAIRGARSENRLTTKLNPGSHASEISPKSRFEAAVGNLNVTGISKANLARKPLSRAVFRRHIEYLIHGENASRIQVIDTPPSVYKGRQPLEFSHLHVHRDEVINADEQASQAEFDEPRWSLEHVLGWIAHRNARQFRRLAPIDSCSL